MISTTTLAFEIALTTAKLRALHDRNVFDALDEARDTVQLQRLELEVRAEAIRADHALGLLKDNEATESLAILDEDRRQLSDELGEIAQVRAAWVCPALTFDGPAQHVTPEPTESDPAPKWQPITDEEIATWAP